MVQLKDMLMLNKFSKMKLPSTEPGNSFCLFLVTSSFQLLLKNPSMPETLTDLSANWLLRQPMDQPLWKLKRFSWQEELSSFPMSSVMLVVLPSVISNGLKIWITSDQEECKESGKKRPEKTSLKSFLRLLDLTQNKLTRNFCLKEPKKETLFMQVWKKLWALPQLRSSTHPERRSLIWEWLPTWTESERSTNSTLLPVFQVVNDRF